jgi:hypothetical protein
MLPAAFAAALLALAALPQVRENPRLIASVLGAGTALIAWIAVLFLQVARTNRLLVVDVAPRRQHYLQACAQGSVLVYWGFFWPTVSVHLILAQLLFAYAFDMLLAWSRRDEYTLGFAPFPVIFSINLFLWFKADWFYLQFLMVAIGFTAKELIRWRRDGRYAHIFNPSSFPLAIVSIALLVTGTTDMTLGREIAITQFYPPHMYLWLFLIGLPGQFFFGVTSMTMSAVVATYAFGLIYYAATGTYFFYDSYIPIAVFLGMHLLFTDPSTSPRTELGRIAFGTLYGLSTVALYFVLGRAGLPTFYDKLLQVPVLNLLVKVIDRAARSNALRRFDPSAIGRSLPVLRRNAAWIGVWTIVFAVMSGTQGVGDDHPGQFVPFWQHACRDGSSRACDYLFNLESILCRAGSGWACNEIAVGPPQAGGASAGWLGRSETLEVLQRGCDLKFRTACENATNLAAGATLQRAPPGPEDYPIILRGSKRPIEERDTRALLARACHQGWPDTCQAGN